LNLFQAENIASAKLQNKLSKIGEFLTAADKRKSKFYFTITSPPLQKKFNHFLEAVGTSWSIFKLLGKKEICLKNR